MVMSPHRPGTAERHRRNLFGAVDQNVERIVVFRECLRNKSVIRRVIDGGGQNAVQAQKACPFIQFEFEIGTLGNFDHRTEVLRKRMAFDARGHVMPGMNHGASG
jgi:hypothetical protein